MMVGSYASDNRKRIAFLSTFPPRECGIATFTKSLVGAIEELNEFKISIIAINEQSAFYIYDRKVKFVIERDNVETYVQAANYINSSDVELVNLQHEFGLFGGDYGEYIKIFLEHVEKPVVTTLHTVQTDFDPRALEVLKYITQKSAAIVVIARPAIKIIENQGVYCRNCNVIPHGAPNIDFVDTETVKESLGLKGHVVASTFGLISSGKGIEYAIRALPRVVKKEPNFLYLIIGQTHPEVRKHEGEKYRNKLMRLVCDLGLEEHVRFHNRYLSKRELIRYLQATDIYITPYISPNQISSGTLTYAMGAGKAVVSTPYFHAQETLANGRGVFCKFKDSYSIAQGIIQLLDVDFRSGIQKRAYKYSRRFLWSNVAKEYVNLFQTTIRENGRTEIAVPAHQT